MCFDKIGIKEFVSNTKELLDNFEEDYLKCNQLKGDKNWPLSATDEEWWDQLQSWIDFNINN